MPSSSEALAAGLRQSLAGVSKKVDSNGEANGLDSALAAGSKLSEITKHHIDFEPADQNQCSVQNLKSKYVVLDTKHVLGSHNTNGIITNGTKDPSSRILLNGNKLNLNGNNSGSQTGPQLNGSKGIHLNGMTYANVNGINKNLGSIGSINGVKKFGSNGVPKGGNENGALKAVNNDSTLPEPKHILYPPDKVTLGWQSHFRAGAGMVNLGNTCYLNATLQALFHVPAFVDWLLSDSDHMKKCEQINGPSYGDCITCAMSRTFRLSQVNQVVRPNLITSKIKMICRHMSHGSQEDAHEFMRHLLENMEKGYLSRCKATKLDPFSKETTPINQIFGGYIRTEVKCLRCNYASTTFQHFQDLILDIRKASKVEDAMDQYFSKEKLDGENSYKCEKCKCGVPATKKYSIERPPKVLCIQLKRFNAIGVKLPKPVEHKTQMDLKRHIHPQSTYAKFSSLPYRLISMVTHVGPTSGCGHYTAIAQCSSKTFHHFDDTHVHPVSLQSVLNNCAYILIYEMEPQTMKQAPKVAAASSVSLNSTGQNNQNHQNGTSKNLLNTTGGLPSVKDRDRVTFGLTPPKPASAPPRLVIHAKRPDGNGSIIPTSKPFNHQNGVGNIEAHTTNFIGPVMANGKHLGSSMTKDKPVPPGNMKIGNSSASSQSDFLKKESSVVVKPELEKKLTGSLVPYDYDDDSSSRDSSLSPPLNDDNEVLTVKATKPSDWQVTNSSGLRSPSIHSESSNHSVASTTGSNWNVTENQSVKCSMSSKTVTNLKIRNERSPTSYSSDPEVENRSAKNAGKSNQRAKSVERELNVGRDTSLSKHSFPNKKARVRRSSLSSESDSSSSSKFMKKKAKVSDDTDNGTSRQESVRSITEQAHVTNERLSTAYQNQSFSSSRNMSVETSQGSKCSTSTWNGDGNSTTVNDLMKMSHQGFGNDRVASWNGEQSQVEKSVEEDRQGSYKRTRDDYEAELDRGRIKKVKKDHYRWRQYPPIFPHRPAHASFNQNRKNYHQNPHHGKNRPNYNNSRWQKADHYNKQPSRQRHY